MIDKWRGAQRFSVHGRHVGLEQKGMNMFPVSDSTALAAKFLFREQLNFSARAGMYALLVIQLPTHQSGVRNEDGFVWTEGRKLKLFVNVWYVQSFDFITLKLLIYWDFRQWYFFVFWWNFKSTFSMIKKYMLHQWRQWRIDH